MRVENTKNVNIPNNDTVIKVQMPGIAPPKYVGMREMWNKFAKNRAQMLKIEQKLAILEHLAHF